MRASLGILAILLLGCHRPKHITERNAERIFATTCAKCHGPDGSGLPEMKAKLGVRDLTDGAWQRTKTDAELTSSIKRGKKNMPAWGPVLDDEQIRAMLGKVRSLARPRP